MLEKAYIASTVNNFTYQVRIPRYNKLAGDATKTPTSDLYIAQVCNPPGYLISYAIGDLVWIDFESDRIDLPVIVGLVYNENTTRSIAELSENNTSTTSLNASSIIPESVMSLIESSLAIHTMAGYDLNTLNKSGIYNCDTTSTHMPPNSTEGVLLVLPAKSKEIVTTNCVQLFFTTEPTTTANAKIYYRHILTENWRILKFE